MEALWERALAELARDPEITRASFATWLKGTRLLERDGARFTVGAQHSFAREKLERSFGGAVARALAVVSGEPAPRVTFVVPGAGRPEPRREERPLPFVVRKQPGATPACGTGHNAEPTDEASAAAPGAPPAPDPAHPGRVRDGLTGGALDPRLDARLTFASFVGSVGTQLALTAARTVAENPVLAYNPLFLYGPAGLGKTHLLHAVGNGALAHRPELRVAYVRAAALAEELGDESDRVALAARLARYRPLDVLLLDDVQALGGRPAQKHVLLLLESLVAGGRQVVCAANVSPRAVPGLDDRLRAFFQSGLVADVAPAEEEARLAILRAKAQLRAVAGERPARRRATPQHVLEAVSVVFGVPAEALLAPRRDRHVVVARQAAMHLMREETGASLAEIGAALGGRDHTTVLHGCEKVARALEVDGKLREHVETAREVVHAALGGRPGAAAHLDSA